MSEKVTLAEGAGGKQTAALIDSVFKENFENNYFTADDAAVLPRPEGRIAVSTDGFVVSPIFFPGGNIGELSICGTVNDLSCMGARPLYLTNSFIIEEGLEKDELRKIVRSMAETAERVGVKIVAGDTKVVPKGKADKVFITTTGVGEIITENPPSGAKAEPGDAVIVTGDIGRHGATILLSRDDYGIEADIESDCAPLWKSVEAAINAVGDVHVIRDATRGGVGTVLYEITRESSVGVRLEAAEIPVAEPVKGVCSMLGLEPLYLACEGTMVMIVPEEKADAVIKAISAFPETHGAKRIGTITAEHSGIVRVSTEIGTETVLPEPGHELLPRIC
ncbi:hydrogenase expression/formation protein HypE [Lachnospiraceae bacterium C1.1]|nr:hydrogenase expression/formation protein HypE [Lachnospiraceae bacterium C1.1]